MQEKVVTAERRLMGFSEKGILEEVKRVEFEKIHKIRQSSNKETIV